MDGVRIKWLGDPVTVDGDADDSKKLPSAEVVKPTVAGGIDDFLQGPSITN